MYIQYTHRYVCLPVLALAMENFAPGKCVASDAVAHFSITFQVNSFSSIVVMSLLVLPLSSPSVQGHYIRTYIFQFHNKHCYILFYYEQDTPTCLVVNIL